VNKMKETYEEYIKRTAEKKSKEYDTHSNVTLRYYPFSESCPIDGRPCSKEYCKYNFYKETKCYNFELNRIIFDVFGVGDNHFWFYDDENINHIDWYITAHATYDNYKNNFMDTGIQIRVSSDSVWEVNMKVLKECGIIDKFNFKKDETTKFYKSSYRNLHKVKKLLEFVKDNNKNISKLFKDAYRCIKCGKSSVHGNIFKEKLICDNCQTEIVTEWVDGTNLIALETE